MKRAALLVASLFTACGVEHGQELGLPPPAPPVVAPPVVEPPCEGVCLEVDATAFGDANTALDGCVPVEDWSPSEQTGEHVRLLDIQLVDQSDTAATIEVTFANVGELSFSEYPGVQLAAVEGPVFVGEMGIATWPLFAMFGCQVETTQFTIGIDTLNGSAKLAVSAGYGFFTPNESAIVDLEWAFDPR